MAKAPVGRTATLRMGWVRDGRGRPVTGADVYIGVDRARASLMLSPCGPDSRGAAWERTTTDRAGQYILAFTLENHPVHGSEGCILVIVHSLSGSGLERGAASRATRFRISRRGHAPRDTLRVNVLVPAKQFL